MLVLENLTHRQDISTSKENFNKINFISMLYSAMMPDPNPFIAILMPAIESKENRYFNTPAPQSIISLENRVITGESSIENSYGCALLSMCSCGEIDSSIYLVDPHYAQVDNHLVDALLLDLPEPSESIMIPANNNVV